ncbi:MAG: hypothetical protein AAFN93_11350, partial [Bacteroidota bacterium]
MLKTNNNKRNITIMIGILVAIAIILTSFGPSMAEGTSDTMTNIFPRLEFPEIRIQHLVQIFYHLK